MSPAAAALRAPRPHEDILSPKEKLRVFADMPAAGRSTSSARSSHATSTRGSHILINLLCEGP